MMVFGMLGPEGGWTCQCMSQRLNSKIVVSNNTFEDLVRLAPEYAFQSVTRIEGCSSTRSDVDKPMLVCIANEVLMPVGILMLYTQQFDYL